MKQLNVPQHMEFVRADSLGAIACGLNKGQKYRLAYTPWAAYPYKPEVYFSIAYCEENMYLQYTVKEKYVAAAHGKTNEPVYEDSCVEFFIGFEDDPAYYNFEFNSIGTVLAAYGTEKTDRTLLSPEALKKINYQVLHQKSGEDETRTWELTIVIPLSLFVFHSLPPLKGKTCRANFYKCGDRLPMPHFLSWSEIESETPDFHLPEFFGTLVFN